MDENKTPNLVDEGVQYKSGKELAKDLQDKISKTVIGVVLSIIELIARSFAIMLDVILGHSFGERHISPLLWVISTLLIVFILQGSTAGMVILGTVGVGMLFLSAFLAFLIVPINIAIFVHYFRAKKLRKEGKHIYSYSMGIPWIYTITKDEYFLTTKFRYWVQPFIVGVVAVLLMLTMIGLPLGIFLLILVGFTFIRNAIVSFRANEIELDKMDAMLMYKMESSNVNINKNLKARYGYEPNIILDRNREDNKI